MCLDQVLICLVLTFIASFVPHEMKLVELFTSVVFLVSEKYPGKNLLNSFILRLLRSSPRRICVLQGTVVPTYDSDPGG